MTQQNQQNTQEIQLTNEMNVQENQTNGTVSPIISEQEQEKILQNFKEYEKILTQLKEQKKREKEMKIRTKIQQKEEEIQALENQIKKEKGERNMLLEELEGITEFKIDITTEKNTTRTSTPIQEKNRYFPEQNNLYPENGNNEEWNDFKNGSYREPKTNGWGRIPEEPRFQNNQYTRKEKGCLNCGIKGHYLQDCPMIKCNICKRNGHIMRFCPDRICRICNRKGHMEVECEQFDPNYNNRKRIQNDIGKEFSFGEKFERNY